MTDRVIAYERALMRAVVNRVATARGLTYHTADLPPDTGEPLEDVVLIPCVLAPPRDLPPG